MKLPVSDQAVIEAAKLRDYLLSFAHPVGRFKAAFFAAYGYTANNWRQLEADLRRLVEAQDVNKSQSSRYGQKYEVRGTIKAPNGSQLRWSQCGSSAEGNTFRALSRRIRERNREL